MLKPIIENIPVELHLLPQWVCWKARPKNDGKVDKIPFDPKTGHPASSTDPATWAVFEQAVKASKNGGGYAGIGFTVNANDNITGVDLDDCVDSGQIEPWAWEIVQRFNSYAEISPSGKGLRIFVQGKLNRPGRRKGKIECYDTGRFLTVTGHRVYGTPGNVESRQQELEAFHLEYIAKEEKPQERPQGGLGLSLDDAELLDRARKAKNGAAFERLYSGDWAGYPSQSEADQAFCNLLAFWTGRNSDQMERLFRQSGLYREKCEKNPTYLGRTIEKAINGCVNTYMERPSAEQDFALDWNGNPEETGANAETNGNPQDKSNETDTEKVKLPQGYTAAELMRTNFPDPNWVIPGVLCEGLTLLCGPPKLGKSWMCLGWGIAIASGGKALNKYDVEKGDVLYLALEDTPRRLKSRLKIMMRGYPAPGNFHLITEWPRVDNGGLIMLDSWANKHPQTKLIIIDTLAKIRHRVKGNTNMYTDDYDAVTGLKSMADSHGIAVVVVHHLSKRISDDPLEQVSGSTGLTGAADTTMILKRDRGQMDGSLFITGRDVNEQELALKFDSLDCTWNILGNVEKFRMSQERVQLLNILEEAGEEPLSISEIEVMTGKGNGAIKKLLFTLYNEGIVKRASRGKYMLTSNFGNFGNQVTSVTSVTNHKDCDSIESKLPEDESKLPKVTVKVTGQKHLEALKHKDTKSKVTKVTKLPEVPTIEEVEKLFGNEL